MNNGVVMKTKKYIVYDSKTFTIYVKMNNMVYGLSKKTPTIILPESKAFEIFQWCFLNRN